jgi:hypothetical protein
VKQSDLDEYEENAREKHNIQYKTPTPPQTKTNYKLPLKPSNVDGKHQVSNSRGSKKSTRFLNTKDHTPPEPRKIKSSIKFN